MKLSAQESFELQAMELENRKIILHNHHENPTWSASKLAKVLKFPKTTVYDVLKRFKETLTVDRAKGTGAKKGSRNPRLEKTVMRSIKSNPGLSDNDRAKRYSTTRSNIRRIRARNGYKSFIAVKTPNRSDKQNSTAKKRARLLYDKVLTKFKGCIIMDDETYVKLDLKQLPGRKFYISNIRGNVAEKFKWVKLDKFAKKVMIWQAICSCGLKSKVFVTSSTMTSAVYIKECLQKRLLPFIKQHRSATKFWADLASVHFSKAAMEWYKANSVDVIPKEMNPPNCPQLRPIEKFWAIVKGKLKRSGGYVKDIKSMRSKWNQFAGKVTRKDVQKLMRPIRKQARLFIRSDEN